MFLYLSFSKLPAQTCSQVCTVQSPRTKLHPTALCRGLVALTRNQLVGILHKTLLRLIKVHPDCLHIPIGFRRVSKTRWFFPGKKEEQKHTLLARRGNNAYTMQKILLMQDGAMSLQQALSGSMAVRLDLDHVFSWVCTMFFILFYLFGGDGRPIKGPSNMD